MSDHAGDYFIAKSDADERWDGPFSTAEEALAEGRERWGRDVTVYVGVGREVDLDALCGDMADTVKERLACDAYDLAGEAAEGWPEWSHDENAELDSKLRDLIKAFLIEKCLTPTWTTIGDVKKYEPSEAA